MRNQIAAHSICAYRRFAVCMIQTSASQPIAARISPPRSDLGFQLMSSRLYSVVKNMQPKNLSSLIHRIPSAAFVSAALMHSACGCAQSDYPVKPVRLIAGFAPGGITDVLARTMAERLSAGLGRQVVVENRPGAGTQIACELVAKAPPDGYTLLFQDITTHAINAPYYRKLSYDTARDFTAIALVAASPLVLAVHPSVPARSVKEFVALAKARPNQLQYGTGGAGTTGHIAGEMFAAASGIQITHIPYKGSGPAVQSVLGGEIAFTFSTTAAVIPLLQSGRLRAP